MLRVSLRKSFDKIFDNVLIELGKRSGMAVPKVDGGLHQYTSVCGGVSEGYSNEAVLFTGKKVIDDALLGSFALGERGMAVPPHWSTRIHVVPDNSFVRESDDTAVPENDDTAVPENDDKEWRADSVRRKRKKKMNKHKHAKRRKLNRHKR